MIQFSKHRYKTKVKYLRRKLTESRKEGDLDDETIDRYMDAIERIRDREK